jgi:hypothetical protein
MSDRDRCHSVPRAAWVCVTKPRFSVFGIGRLRAEVAHACTHEIDWIAERQYWRGFLCSVRKLA